MTAVPPWFNLNLDVRIYRSFNDITGLHFRHSSCFKPLKKAETEEFDRMTIQNLTSFCGIPLRRLPSWLDFSLRIMRVLKYWLRTNTGLNCINTHWRRLWLDRLRWLQPFGRALTEAMLVWLAIIRPLTRWAEGRYGDFLDRATWMLAGPHGMKLASLRSRILWRLLCTCKAQRVISFALKMRKVMFWSPCIYLFVCVFLA